jgi:tRNA A-37 threonylcarbamoyl transferase component Bud32
MYWIKDFKGHSGCQVQLFNDNDRYTVIKSGNKNLKKSAEILTKLQAAGFKIPTIYKVGEDFIHMQYLNGVDIKTYLENATIDDLKKLFAFLDRYIDFLSNYPVENISNKIQNKLIEIKNKFDVGCFVFTLDDLFNKLPTTGRVGLIHGDFTLDNIIFYDDDFYFIDSNPTELNCAEFDIVKIRQDLDCLWFIRNQKDKILFKIVCDKLSNDLKNKWPIMNNDYILIFMLLRIMPYCVDEMTKIFLITEINKLWR